MNGGDLVYLARSKAGITQAELGRRAGMAQNAVARTESGKVRASFETVCDLVRACGFEVEFSLATYDDSYRRDINRRRQLSPLERLERSAALTKTNQRLRRAVVDGGG